MTYVSEISSFRLDKCDRPGFSFRCKPCHCRSLHVCHFLCCDFAWKTRKPRKFVPSFPLPLSVLQSSQNCSPLRTDNVCRQINVQAYFYAKRSLISPIWQGQNTLLSIVKFFTLFQIVEWHKYYTTENPYKYVAYSVRSDCHHNFDASRQSSSLATYFKVLNFVLLISCHTPNTWTIFKQQSTHRKSNLSYQFH